MSEPEPNSGKHTLSDQNSSTSTSSDDDSPPAVPQNVGGSQSQSQVGGSQSQGGTSAETQFKLKNTSVRILGKNLAFYSKLSPTILNSW